MRQHLFAKFGVDLTAVEGVSIQTVLAFLSEVGTDVSKFATAEHFGSWLGLCPDNRITGGRTHAAADFKLRYLDIGTRVVALIDNDTIAGAGTDDRYFGNGHLHHGIANRLV